MWGPLGWAGPLTLLCLGEDLIHDMKQRCPKLKVRR